MTRWLLAIGLVALTACFDPVGGAGDGGLQRADAAAAPPGLDAAGPGADAALADAGVFECSSYRCLSDGTCTVAALPAGSVCRAAVGECDVEEVCDGVALTCPSDQVAPKATYCGNVSWCTGLSGTCPVGTGEWPASVDGRWYWSNPLPQGYDLYGIWGATGDDIWAVGQAGTILHWDGAAWAPAASPTTQNLMAVWGSSASDVWAVGYEGVILHFDGILWSSVVASEPDVRLWTIWGSGPNDIWVGGTVMVWGPMPTNGPAVARHWDGYAWTPVEIAPHLTSISAIAGSAADDVWAIGAVGGAVGGASNLFHWDGSSWTLGPGASSGNFSRLWVGGRGDAWAMFRFDVAAHWDGSAWSKVAIAANGYISSIWGTASNDVWALAGPGSPVLWTTELLHWDGAGWSSSPFDSDHELTRLWGVSGSDLWAVGGGGAMLHSDGQTWTHASSGPNVAFRKVSAIGPQDVWFTGYRPTTPKSGGMVLRWDGAAWRDVWPDSSKAPGGLWGSAPNDVWVSDERADGAIELARWNGSSWTFEPSEITCLSGTSASDVWGGGASALQHWDGTSWSHSMSVPSPTTALWSESPSNVWAMAGRALRWDGSSWLDTGPGNRSGVWGASPSDVWAVGWEVMDHWDGAGWTSVDPGTTAALQAVWGTGRDDVWAVGSTPNGSFTAHNEHTFLHWDGVSWQREPKLSAVSLNGISGTGPDNVWAAGWLGAILHRK